MPRAISVFRKAGFPVGISSRLAHTWRRRASGHRADDLTENGIDDILNVALVKVRALASDAPDGAVT
jgi:hypothetical protein